MTTQQLTLKLPVFEGPLDLLLHLIQTSKVEINDIPIVSITEQYMAYLQSFELLSLDIAGDYLVMAATLMSIKSKLLLPNVPLETDDFPEEEDFEDPRDELVAQLLAYQQFKEAALLLQDKEELRQSFYTKAPSAIETDQEMIVPMPQNGVSMQDLLDSFARMLRQQKNKRPRLVSVKSETFTVEMSMQAIRQQLKTSRTKRCSFEELLQQATPEEIVTCFLAILELTKKGQLELTQEREKMIIVHLIEEEEHDETIAT